MISDFGLNTTCAWMLRSLTPDKSKSSAQRPVSALFLVMIGFPIIFILTGKNHFMMYDDIQVVKGAT